MTITAFDGPLVTNPANPSGFFAANLNPEAAPSMWDRGDSILDPRSPFTYYYGQDFGQKTYGIYSASVLQTLDQVPSAIADNNIAASQSPGATTALTLVSVSGAGITAGVSIRNAATGATVTGLLAIDGAMGSVSFGQAATVQMWDPTKAIARNVRITSGGDDHTITFTVNGYDIYGYPMTEAITGANTGIASGKKAFKYISSITHTGSVASTVKVGTGDVYGLPVRADRIPYILAWWGSPQGLIAGPGGSLTEAETTVTIPIYANSTLANSQVYATAVPFGFTVKSAAYFTEVPVTTGAKAATLTLQVNGVSVGTGGVISLTSAAMTPTGAIVPSSPASGTGITANSSTSAVTITIASPGVITWPNHGLAAGQVVNFSTTGALPTGLTAGTNYYVISAGLATNSFEVSATVGGAAVNTTGTQSGVHTATAVPTVGFVVSGVTTFVEGNGYVSITLVNNDLAGGTFTAPDTTSPATTTTGDVRGTIATPSNSDGTKRLTVWVTPSVVNIGSNVATGLFGVTQV